MSRNPQGITEQGRKEKPPHSLPLNPCIASSGIVLCVKLNSSPGGMQSLARAFLNNRTMSNTSVATRKADQLAQKLGGQWNGDQIVAVAKGGIVPASALADPMNIEIFFRTAQAAGANPFLKHCHMISRNAQVNGQWVTTYSTVFDYKFLRAKCDETGEWGGQDEVTFDGGKKLHELPENQIPKTATATVYRWKNGIRQPTTVTVRFSEYSSGKSTWKAKPCTMIGKVATAQATRAAFPAATEGLHTPEEMDHLEVPAQYSEEDILIETHDPLPEALMEIAAATDRQRLRQITGKYTDLNNRPEWVKACEERHDELQAEEVG